MEWPHDPDSEEGSEGGRLYGHAIFAKKLADMEYPLDIQSFTEAVGHHPIRIDHETVVPAAEILDLVEVAEVDDIQAFHQAVGTAMRSGGYWPYDPSIEVPGQ